jgi:hypothetical protein
VTCSPYAQQVLQPDASKKNNYNSSSNDNDNNNNKNNDKLHFVITEERKCRRFNPVIHTFSKNLGAASKFQAPGG